MTRRTRSEQGSATVFVIGFALVLFLCAGLVIDGGLAINKRMRIADNAEQAARIGADTIDVETFRETDQIVIDQPAAEVRMRDYLRGVDFTGGVSITWVDRPNATAVPRVELTDQSKTFILDLFKVEFPVRASAEAVPDTGQPVAP